MVQIIGQTDIGSQLGGALGGGLSQGISSGLDLLVRAKMEGLSSQAKNQLQMQRLAQIQSILGGADVMGSDTDVDFLDAAQENPSTGEISNEQILAISQLDPNLAKIMQSQKDSSSKETATRFKETKDVRKSIVSQARAARENDMRLNRMSELNKEGKLISGLYNDSLKKLGIDFDTLKNPESIEFQKLSTDFLRNAKEIFGSRVTNFEIGTFLKAIPSLSQSPEGRDRVIRNLQLLNKGADFRLKAMKEVMKENKGVPPYDLDERIEEKVGPQLEEISKEFIEGPSGTQASESITFESLPSASEFEGKIIRDTKTGKRLKSDGKKWKEVK